MKPFAVYLLFLVLVVIYLPVFGQGQGYRLKTVLVSLYDQDGFVPLEKYDFTYNAGSGTLPPDFDVEECLQFMPDQGLSFPGTPKLLKFATAIVSEFINIHDSTVVHTHYYWQMFDKAGRCVRCAGYGDSVSAIYPDSGQGPEKLYTFGYREDGTLAAVSEFTDGYIYKEQHYNAVGYCDTAHEYQYGDNTIITDCLLVNAERKPMNGGGYVLAQTYKGIYSFVFDIRHTYDTSGHVTAMEYQSGQSIYNKKRYTYDGMGRKTTEVSYSVDIGGRQQPIRIKYYYYNEDGLPVRIEEKSWDEEREQWVDGILTYVGRQYMPYSYSGVYKTELFYEPVK